MIRQSRSSSATEFKVTQEPVSMEINKVILPLFLLQFLSPLLFHTMSDWKFLYLFIDEVTYTYSLQHGVLKSIYLWDG